MNDATHWDTATELGRRIQRGELTSVDTTGALLNRIRRPDSALHSYHQVLEDDALEQAQNLDRERQIGQCRGPLHGVPIAVKDLLAVKGLTRGAGTRVLRQSAPAARDAAAVSRLRQAGAVVIGTLSMTEGALSTYHPDVAMPVNPWAADRWSGVSSSGSGVAVAAGLCFAALGTDTGGSIRYPSAVNGVVGLKPTYGLVPSQGCFPLCPSMDHIGPICRSVEDAAYVLAAIAADQTVAGAVSQPPSLAGIRLGVDYRYIRDGSDPSIIDPILANLSIFEAAGVELVDITMPDWSSIETAWMLLCAVEAAAVHSPWFPAEREHYGEEFAAFLDYGLNPERELVSAGNRARQEFTTELARLFGSVELIFSPTLGIRVPGSIRNKEDRFPTMMRFTAPFSASGSPTLSMPCGFSDDGLPLSLQIIAAHGGDSLLLQVGMAYQRRTLWHRQHPDC